MKDRLKKILAFTSAAALIGTAALAQDFVVGITFDAGGKFDASFNEGTWNGLVRAVDELSATYEIDILEYEPSSGGQTADGQRRMARDEGAEVIIAPGFNQEDAVESVAAEFPDTAFVIIDTEAEAADNIRSVMFRDQEGSYLVGYIAGKLTQSGTVGFVGGMDVPLIRNFNQGYAMGVLAACEDCTVISNYVGVTPDAWNDPATAKELASLQHAQDADIIYSAAGGSGRGTIDFINERQCWVPSGDLRNPEFKERVDGIAKSAEYEAACEADAVPLFFIGVDSNQNPEGDTDGDPTTLNHGLTSMLKRVDTAAYTAVMDVVDGTFTPGLQELGVAEEGVGFALDEYNEDLLSEELLAELEEVAAAIASGEIVVPDYRDE
ncbi:MAG TPA: BMP family ABC transporter substrate-binding protein, partial [Deinococcales bacterium]|nr:BMP family ABC transporter substrate-binding protein [Deinococcales bacterium]